MTLRLNGSSSGFTELNAPAAAGSNTLTLPTSNGSADQFLKNSGTTGQLEFSDMVEDSSGRLLVGHSSSRDVANVAQPKIQIEGTNVSTSTLSVARNSNDAGGPVLALSKTRGTSTGSSTVVQSGDTAGSIYFSGADGTDVNSYAAWIEAEIDSTPGGNDMPGRLVFSTTADGANSPTERMRLDSGGRLGIGATPGNQEQLLVHGGDTSIYVPFARSDSRWLTIHSGGSDPGIFTNTGSALRFGHGSARNNFSTERMRIDSDGRLISLPTYNATSGSSGNVGISSSGKFYRSTSSGKYKTNVETIEDTYADALLNCRPVWYRSLCADDNPEHGYWGFIAEEVAEIDPRLVYWKTADVSYDENGSFVETACDPEPEGVAYDRFVPHLLNLIKRQKTRIETLETQNTAQQAQIDDLLARVTALEAA